MVTAAEAAALVESSMATKKRAREEIEEDGGEAEHMNRMRWHARVAALERVPRMAKVPAAAATAVGRQASFVDAFNGKESEFQMRSASNAALQPDAPGTAMALTASPSAAGRTGAPSDAPSFLTSGGHRCLAIGDAHRIATPPVHSPCSRAMQGGPRGKKRKSPCAPMGIFRSPLSRMMLSPRPRLSFTPSPRQAKHRLPFSDYMDAECHTRQDLLIIHSSARSRSNKHSAAAEQHAWR
ncbi:hypothetical protein EJB05_01446 [Eragrostis curvula]|uniref:Uncharacterized protein n=1 Tax=Eragrostis curvula TaxID=38414 RepID=A0A5J9WPK8_9POAL|nr:hypothetical protein EJB05_01446 [Eragrostis curvula]